MKLMRRKIQAAADLSDVELVFTTEQFGSFLRSLPQMDGQSISISACGESGVLVMIGNLSYLFATDEALATI